MTKAILCWACGDIVSPYRINRLPKPCLCGESAVWWEDMHLGILSVFHLYGRASEVISVLGIHNGFLEMTEYTKESVQRLLEDTEDYYLFKQLMTPLVKIIPGTTRDTFIKDKIPVFHKRFDDRHKPFCEKIPKEFGGTD